MNPAQEIAEIYADHIFRLEDAEGRPSARAHPVDLLEELRAILDLANVRPGPIA